MTFREKIEKKVLSLNSDQIIILSRQSAIRALPFLAVKDYFHYWTEKNIQEILFQIFYAIDCNIAIATGTIFTGTNPIDAYRNAEEIGHAIFKDSNSILNSVAYVAFAASRAARAAAYIAEIDLSSFNNFIERLVRSATVSAVLHTINAARNNGIDLKAILEQDLKDIKTYKKTEVSTAIYGDHWSKFLESLESVGCGYWAKLYQSIFDNNFEFDLEELKRRMNVPKEIKEQGAAAVGEYLEKLKSEGAKKLNEARIIILGNKGAGKTCVARKLVDPEAAMTKPVESTAGVDKSVWLLDEDDINVNIWDFAGHTVTHAVHQFFLSERCLYIMVYDGRSEKRNQLEYWLDHMMNYGGNSKAIILVNERDQHKIKLHEHYLKEKYSIAGFFSFNVEKDKSDLNEFRDFVANYIRNNPSWKHQEIPWSYYLVKEDLESRFNKEGKGEEHISKQTFFEIAEKHKVTEPETLLQDLHYLGVSLWYKDMDDYDTLILNPEWISQGVYQIINWVSNAKKHSLNLRTFSTVFAENINRYPEDKHRFLFNLIKHYELAFETKGDQLIIPHLLEEDQPETLPEFPETRSLFMRYEADSPLPPNTISRFIVRHNEQIKKEGNKLLIWKQGVILDDQKGSLALIREIDRRIHVSVKGNDKTNFLSAIRSSLNSIFDTYESQDPELTYKIVDAKLKPQQSLYLVEEEIVTHVVKKRRYYDYESGEEIPLKPTADKYNIPLPLTLQNQGIDLMRSATTSPAYDQKQNEIDKLKAELEEQKAQLAKQEAKAKEEKRKEFIRKKVRRWKFKSLIFFITCLILFSSGLFYFYYQADWDLVKAKKLLMDWQENIAVFGFMAVTGIIFSFSSKWCYSNHFSQSQLKNFKSNLEIPEELK